jgi:WhiB family redox-sensing transcriptional regulator
VVQVEEQSNSRSWWKRANCLGSDPELFHPTKAGVASQAQVRAAKMICHRCEVREECLAYALEHREPHGIWGGKTVVERAKMLGLDHSIRGPRYGPQS